MSFSEKAWEVFNQSITNYHVSDDVNSVIDNPYMDNSLEQILYAKNWIDTVQWHLEDIIREDEIEPSKALKLKREIDASNQKRTDLVEYVDAWFYEKYKTVEAKTSAKINTETIAWAVDRLSILALKVFHMRQEAERESASDEHRLKCKTKLDVLLEQHKDLSNAIDQLLVDIENGDVKIKLYKQMKMYNDDSLNPILYQKTKK